MIYQLKPSKSAFLLNVLNSQKGIVFAGLGVALLSTIILSVALKLDIFISILIGLTIIIFLLSIFLANFFYSYNLENYKIFENRIEVESGNIFKKSKTSIDLSKIVSFTEFQPFFRSLLFGTKSIFLQTSGTQSSIIILNDLKVDNSYFELIKQISKATDMSFIENFKELKPSYLNALISAINASWNILYSLGLYILYLIIGAIISDGNISSVQNTPIQIILLFYVFGSIISASYQLILALIQIYFTNFIIYKNQIQFSYGIFSKFNVYLPISKITDTQFTRSFWEKVLGLKSISLSVPNNPNLAIIRGIQNDYILPDLLKKDFKQEIRNIDIEIDSSEVVEIKKALSPSKKRYFLDVLIQASFILIIIMIAFLVPALFWLLIPSIGVFYSLFLLTTEVFFTKYILEENYISRNYDFLSTKKLKLTKENTTSIKITESILDKLFGTFSITFYSLGGSESIKILYVNKNSEIYNYALSFINFEIEKETLIDLDFNFSDWLISIIYQLPQIFIVSFALIFWIPLFLSQINLIFIAIILILILLFFGFLILNNYLALKNASLRTSNDFLSYKYGWLIKTTQILKKDFIKDFVTVKYPFRKSAELTAHLSSDLSISQNQNIFSSILGNSFNQINTKFLNLENVKLFQIDKSYEPKDIVTQAKPNFVNTFLKIFIFGIIFPPIIILIIYSYFRNKFTNYICEDDKIIEQTGIFFKREKFLLFSDIDHAEISQDFMNKIVGNFTINIFTSANEIIEIIIRDIKNPSEFMNKINSQS